jgi:uncharacterized protein (DUF488 family)
MNKHGDETPLILFSIGHSTRTIEGFISLLKAYDIAEVVDIRTVPRSRHNPQFNRENLPDTLKAADIGYVHMAELGGLRHAKHNSSNMGWRNASFRGFDYMQTQEFEEALQTLIQLAREKRIALMCAEAVPWRCHHSLIADALLIRNIRVKHIMSPTRSQTHRLTPFAEVEGIRITYPPTDSEQ